MEVSRWRGRIVMGVRCDLWYSRGMRMREREKELEVVDDKIKNEKRERLGKGSDGDDGKQETKTK